MGSRGSTRNGFPKRTDLRRRELLALTALGFASGVPGIAWAAAPTGQLTWAIHVSLAPTWFDPAETEALITPYMVLYALHDAMVKPMPGKNSDAVPCRVVDGIARRAQLRLRVAQGGQIPQW